MFQQLSLAKKVEFIEQAGPLMSQKPKLEGSNITKGIFGGGLSGAMTGAIFGATLKRDPRIFAAYGAVGGAIAGGMGGLIRSIMDKTRDRETQIIAGKSGLDALVARSGSNPVKGSPFGINKYLELIEGSGEKDIFHKYIDSEYYPSL